MDDFCGKCVLLCCCFLIILLYSKLSFIQIAVGCVSVHQYLLSPSSSRLASHQVPFFCFWLSMGPWDTETRRHRQLERPDVGFLFCVLFGWLLEPQRADSPGAVTKQQYSPPSSIRTTGHQLPFRVNSHAKLIGLCRGDGGLATTYILLLCFGGFGGNTNRHNNNKTYAKWKMLFLPV